MFITFCLMLLVFHLMCGLVDGESWIETWLMCAKLPEWILCESHLWVTGGIRVGYQTKIASKMQAFDIEFPVLLKNDQVNS